MSFARHQTFYLRSGWLSKALYNLSDDPKLFSRQNATSTLGIGRNMVLALKFWVVACDLVTKKDYKLTRFGHLVLKHDPYFEEDITWWIIHKNLVWDINEATSWYYLFNIFPDHHFTEERFLSSLDRFCKEELDTKVSPNTLKKDFQCIIATYQKTAANGTPENNMICPLTKLGLLSSTEYGFYKQPAQQLPDIVAYFTIANKAKTKSHINIADITESDLSLAKVFNLTPNMVYEILARLEDQGLLTYSRTGGLDSIILQADPNLVLEKYYESISRR